MKFLVVVLLVICAQEALAQDRGAEQTFVGCYELRIEGRPRIDYANQFLPKRFELKNKHVYGGLVAENLDTRVHWDLSFSSWHVNRDGSLTIDWSTGYVGWTIQLKRSGADDLGGTAHYWTDTDSDLLIRRTSPVIVRNAKCDELKDKS